MTIEARAICDSIGEHSPRLLTIRATNPKFIHQETLRHRMVYIEDALRGDPDFSFSVSSARAIPFRILLDEVTNDDRRAKPVKWGAEQKGMSPSELDNEDEIDAQAELIWKEAALDAARHAQRMAAIGRHKSIVNRIIEPYIHVHCLMTATSPGWLNFFGLRLDKAADPTLRALAEECWKCWNESTPRKLEPGQWHLPFVEDEDYVAIHAAIQQRVLTSLKELGEAAVRDKVGRDALIAKLENAGVMDYPLRVSTGRCARLSYTSFETGRRSTVEENLSLYERLVGGYPIHASPAEHQATPDIKVPVVSASHEAYDGTYLGSIIDDNGFVWEKGHLSGNLGPGWIQHRKLLPGETVAPLPEGYARGM